MTPLLLAILPLVCCSSEPDSSAGESVIHSLPPVHHAPYAPHSSHPGPYTPTPYPPYGYPAPPQHALAVATLPGSAVLRNPFEQHSIQDAIRTQDADLPPHQPGLALPHLPAPGPTGLHGPVGLHHELPHHGPLGHHQQLGGPIGLHGLPHHPDPILTHHHLKEYRPYQYDISKIPECAFTNQEYYNLTFCLQDDYYPVDTIKHELERNKPLVDRILSDITYQSADNLVDGLTKGQEEGYTYQHYFGSSKHLAYGEDFRGYSHAPEYYKAGGYICPSDIFYGRPKRAVNTYGKWKVIVNLPDEYYAQGYGSGYEAYTQTQRLEQCMYPGAPCSFIDPHYHSACLQKHNFVRLLCYTYEEGLHIDSFKLPISCSCHLSQPSHYSPYSPPHGHSPAPPHHAPPYRPPPPPSYHPSPAPYQPAPYHATPIPNHPDVPPSYHPDVHPSTHPEVPLPPPSYHPSPAPVYHGASPTPFHQGKK